MNAIHHPAFAHLIPELSAVERVRKEVREIERLPEVAMPVDIDDEQAFPEIARLRKHAAEKGL